MAPVLTDNPFLDTVLTAEVFDEAAVTGALHALLYDRETRDRLATARAGYFADIGELPPTAAVVRAAVAAAWRA